MLRRHSSKSKSDLHHRKSTSSVRSVPLEHISVAAAQRDAKLAALEAFARGQDRCAVDMTLFPPQQASPNKKENASPTVQVTRHRSVSSLNSEHNRQILDRRQSVRFVAPDYSLRTSASRISTRAVAPVKDPTTYRRAIQKSKSVQDVDTLGRLHSDMPGFRPSDRTSSRGKAMPALRHDYTQALVPDTQCYTPEDDIASQPSSYHRVRKSKSMLTPRYNSRLGQDRRAERSLSGMHLPDETKQAVSPSLWPRLSFLHRKSSDLTLSTTTLRARKSLSFVKHRRDHASTAVAPKDPALPPPAGLTVSPLPESSIRSRLLTKPSTLFASKDIKAGQSGSRILLRNSSNGIAYISETTNNIPLSTHGSMRAKARKASSSIKTRFKSLFVNKSEDDASLPAQQIVAQRTHLSIASNGRLEAEAPGLGEFPKRSSLGSVLFTKSSSLSRIMPQIPSLTAVPSNELLRSRKGSIESFKSINRSFSEDKSRVTSWATSTEANTVVAHKMVEYPEDCDRQRLSVISENELQAASSSAGPSVSYSQSTESQSLVADGWEPASRRPVVDSQRVYSALMKRMNDTRQIAELVAQQRKSSDNSDPFRTLSPPTSDDSSENRSSPAICRSPTRPGNSAPSHSSSDAADTPHNVLSNPGTKQHRPLSPPVHLNPQGVDLSSSVPRADRGSAFFGSPTSHLFRTRSPWRRSLQKALEKEQALTPEPLAVDTLSADTINVTATDDKKIDTASIYSQESQIHKPELHQEFPVAGDDLSTYIGGGEDAVPEALNPHRTEQRLISTASSIGWKAQLSHDMAKAGRLSLPPTRVTGRASEVEYVVPTMPKAFSHGHIREEAQIESYDEDEGHTSPAVRLPTQASTPLGDIEPNVVKLSPQQRSVMQRTPPPVPAHEAASAKQSKSAVALQSFARTRADETGSPCRAGSPTVRLSRKPVAKQEHGPASAASTPYFSSAFERQFGTFPCRLSCDIAEKENKSPHGEDYVAGTQRTGSPGGKGQIGKSSTMADVLLDGRHRQRRSGDGAAFV